MMFKKILIILIVFLERRQILSIKPKIECGYKQCPQTRDGALNVHLIPHSHMDAGWVKTFDEYYFGTRTTISTANVQLIYHSVLSELLHDRRRKFTFAETAYFWRWWKEQRPATRATFRSLVQEGRIEFAGGGWVQNDEATLDYLQIIDHFTWGLRKINDTLGPCGKPKAAWQIDTYGHTREQASLLAQMGYDGLFIGRVDHKEREAMIDEDRMEFMWRGSDVLGKMSDIMTHTLFNLYNAPDGFCFDFLCSDEPIVDDPDNRAYNAEKRVNDFIVQIERQAKYYDHDNIMVTMGGDFTYQGAANWFMNMDKLINHVNTHPANISDVNIFYSTPSCYLKAIYLYGRRDKAVFTERDDHIPYGSDSNTYWTGYYTSRPSLKYFVKRAHTFLQVVKQLTVIARMGDSFELHLLRHAVNLVLHHDAITGTSQQHVTNDFVRTLSEAIESCTKKVSHMLSFLTPTWGGSRRSKNSQQFIVCHQLNMTQCRFTDTQDTILLLVYNPLSVKTYHHVRIPAIALHYSIRDYNDEEVEYQLVPLPAAVINLPGRSSTAIQELCFEAENIPPLGFSAYYITPVRDQLEESEFAKKVALNKQPEADQELSPQISNEYIKVTVSKETGLLESIQHLDGVKIDLSQNFHYYSQTQQVSQSGAYSFRPERSRPLPVTDKVTFNAVRGTIVKEIRQRFTDWITQVIRLYRGEEFVELEWIIGPVPIGTDLGKEVVSIFKTNVTNSGQFYTDSNGRQMMKRTCWNETATHQQKKPVASCFYPVTSRICIQSLNTSVGICVLTDRTQGGTSYNEGEIELMVHRRLLTDDGFGLEESLNEEEYGVGLVAKGRHRLYFGNYRQEVDDLTFSERMASASRRWQLEPWLFFTSGEKINRRKWQNLRTKRYSVLKLHGLPRHIHVLTLEPWKAGSVLLRLENTLEKPVRGRFRNEKVDGPEDYVTKSSHISVQLRKIFIHLKIRMVRETTLAGNQWLDDARQMDWSTRYVYSGADDDILPEDNVELYKEDVKSIKEDAKETGPYSDEERDYRVIKQRSQNINRRRTRSKFKTNYEGDRLKRSLGNENIMENIINGTFNDRNNTTDDIEIPTTTNINDPIILGLLNVTSTKEFGHYVKDPTKPLFGRNKLKPPPPNEKINSWVKPTRFFVDFDKESEEMATEEEDFSSNLKKKNKKLRGERKGKRNKPKPELPAADVEDDITKSMYDMYYRTKPRPPRFRSLTRSSEEMTETTKSKKRKVKGTVTGSEENSSTEATRDSDETTTSQEMPQRGRKRRKQRKGLKAETPFFLNTRHGIKKKVSDRTLVEDSAEDGKGEEYSKKNGDKELIPKMSETTKARRIRGGSTTKEGGRRDEEADEYEGGAEVEDEKETEKEYRPKGERKTYRRRRAAAGEDPTPEPTAASEQEIEEPDYIITLRPTQIRTFVIWFENTKKTYTI